MLKTYHKTMCSIPSQSLSLYWPTIWAPKIPNLNCISVFGFFVIIIFSPFLSFCFSSDSFLWISSGFGGSGSTFFTSFGGFFTTFQAGFWAVFSSLTAVGAVFTVLAYFSTFYRLLSFWNNYLGLQAVSSELIPIIRAFFAFESSASAARTTDSQFQFTIN
ncbi:Hypothetical_protein [Hexamita inflata]|uniref:Hypothetical_protein n=1 Tax=Hexamita inflata TaxID=28002 RepID=A0AA86PF74_9EUKA|nr:Hypothetical protein HINF_LOCUS24701 [Hexamita inflata]